MEPHTASGLPGVIDAETVKETLSRIFLSSRLSEEDDLRELLEKARGHVQLLAPEVRRIAPCMTRAMRSLAVHVLIDTAEILMEGEELGDDPAKLGCHVFDLATMSRALLSLMEHSGPLGGPIHEAEVEAEMKRRVCGLCMGDISEGEPVERRVMPSASSGGVNAYIHAALCAGEPKLTLVPPEGIRPGE